jgi:hypothetical protein
VIVTRMRDTATATTDPHMGFPIKPAGFVYPPALLARTAQLLHRTTSLTLPDDVPTAIAEVYEREQHRCDNPEWGTALKRWDDDRWWDDGALQITARNAALPPPGNSVDGLNQRHTDAEQIMVRAGEMPLEIILLRHDTDGLLHAVGTDITFQRDGTVIGPLKTADVGAQVSASTIRISHKTLIAALYDNPPLPRWKDHPWLRNTGVLLLDTTGTATVPTARGDIRLTYSREVGLLWST